MAAMTRAAQLKAFIPRIFRLYALAKTRSDEHRAIVLLHALGIKTIEPSVACGECETLTPAEWLRR